MAKSPPGSVCHSCHPSRSSLSAFLGDVTGNIRTELRGSTGLPVSTEVSRKARGGTSGTDVPGDPCANAVKTKLIMMGLGVVRRGGVIVPGVPVLMRCGGFS